MLLAHRRASFLVLLLGVGAFIHCGGAGAPTSSGSTPVPIEILSISELPNASAAVVASASGNLSAADVVPVTKAAATGFTLGDTAACAIGASTSSCKFTSSTSENMCQHVNALAGLVTGQIRSDREFCIFQQLASALDSTSVDANDGKTHVVGITWQNSSGKKPTKVQLQEVVSGGSISTLTLHHCLNSSQNYYVNYSISGNDITIDEVDSTSSGSTAFTITGTLSEASDGSLTFTDNKSMTSTHVETGVSIKTKGTFIQTASTFVVTNTTLFLPTSTVRLSGKSELLGGSSVASNPLAYAIGDGNSYIDDTQGYWNGDTFLAVAASDSATDYTITAPAAAVDASSVTASFSGEKAWDCSGTAETTVTLNETTVDQACKAFVSEPSFMLCDGSTSGVGSGSSSASSISISSVKAFETNNVSNTGTLTESSSNPLTLNLSTSGGQAYFEVTFSEDISTGSVRTDNVILQTTSGTSVGVHFDVGSSSNVLQVLLGESQGDTVTLTSGTTYELKIVGDTETANPIRSGNAGGGTVDPTKQFYFKME